MSKAVFLFVGTGGHVLPAYNVVKSMLNKGIDKKNILNKGASDRSRFLNECIEEIKLVSDVIIKNDLIFYSNLLLFN